jgi:trimethylamine:corrinoid methyltransferase-like protein
METNKRVQDVSKGFIGGQYKPLTDQEVETIHLASLTILERTGIQAEDTDTLRLFDQAGACVNGSRGRFPPAMVEDALEFIHFYLLPVYPTDLPESSVEINRFGIIPSKKNHYLDA